MDKTKKGFLGIGVIAAIAVLTFAFAASGSDSVVEPNVEGNGMTVAASAVTSSINYQGRLTDTAGEPLSGTYTMTFKLYEVASGGTALDTDSHSITATEGLLNTDIGFDQEYFDGRELWLGITVGGEEMSPRQKFKPVPYALSLVPGAVINGSVSGAALEVNNTGEYSEGVWVKTTGNSSDGVWVKTTGNSSDGVYAKTTGKESEGFFASTTGYNSWGVYAKTTGNSGNGVGASTTGDNSEGVWVKTTGDSSDGVYAKTTGKESEGFFASTTGYNSWGVYATVTGNAGNGVGAYTTGNNSEVG